MDCTNWKRILLHWANQTNLFDRVYYNIEQTDAEMFFEKFRNKMSTSINATELPLFMKQQYPEFELHLDDENNLSSSDYMYIYSLLLHFSCVKCPESFFHETCQSLPEQFQQVIATFFKILLQRENFSKETLRDAIASSAPKSSMSFMPMESPIRTPRHKISPPTPKTNMLEERTRELNLLRAQLESERYEKGFLELQLKQNEEKITKLAQEQKTHIAEICNLKNELLTRNTENYSPNKNCEEEQIRKRLRKDIAEKEENILNLKDSLESLGEEKVFLREKLNYAEKQVLTCLDKIKEMDYQINELKADIEKRDMTIRSLTETKNELELYISECRSLSHGRFDFNVSAECLDISLTHTTNSSNSILSSPENLGVSVVDIQLREKECENSRLSDQIDRMQSDCAKLAKHLCELIVRYADTFDICNENSVLIDEADLTHTFMVFENYVEKMIETHTASKQSLKTIQEENAEIQKQNASMVTKIAELERDLLACRAQVESLRSEKSSLEQRNSSYATELEKYQEDIDRLNKMHTEVQSRLQETCREYDTMKQENDEKINQLIAENSGIECQLKNMHHNQEELLKAKSQLEEANGNFEQRVDFLLADLDMKVQKIHEHEEENINLKVTIETHVTDIGEHVGKINEMTGIIVKLEEAIQVLNEEKSVLIDGTEKMQLTMDTLKSQLEKLKSEYENEIQINRQQSDEIDTFRTTLSTKEMSIQSLVECNGELETKLLETSRVILDLKARVSEITANRDHFKNGYETLKETISSMDTKFLEKEDILSKTQRDYQNYCKEKEIELKNIQDECIAKVVNCKSEIGDLSTKLDDLNEKNALLQFEITERDQQIKVMNVDFENLKQEKALVEECFEEEKLIWEQSSNSLQLRNIDLENEMTIVLRLVTNTDERGSSQCEIVSENPIKSLKDRVGDLLVTNTELSRAGAELRSVISDLESQISEFKKSSFDLSGVCKNLADEITLLESKVQYLESDKSSLLESIADLKKQLAELQDSESMVRDTQLQSEVEVKSLHAKLEAATSEGERLSNDILLLKNSEKALQQKLEEIQADVAARMEKESMLTKQIVDLEHECAEARKEHSQLEKDIVGSKMIIAGVSAEKSSLADELERFRLSASECTTKLVAIETEKISLQEKVEKLATELAEMKAIEKELNENVEQSKDLEKYLEEKEVLLQAALKESSSLKETEAMLQAGQKEMEANIFERQIKINELGEIISNYELKLTELVSSILQKDLVIEDCTERIASLEQLVAERDATLDEWRQVILSADAECNQVIKGNSETIALLENRVETFKNEKKALEIVNNALQENVDEIENSLKQAQAVNVELLTKIDELKSSNAENTERETDYINLQFKHHATCTEKDQLIQSKQKLEENCSKLNKRLEKVSLKLGDVQATVQKLEKSNNEYRNEMEPLQKTYQQTKLRNEELQGKLSSSQKDLKAANEKVNGLQKAYDKEAARCIALDTELSELQNKIKVEKCALEDELGATNNKASDLQNRYDEQVTKSYSLNNELQQIRESLESKELEIQNQSSFLAEVKSNLQNKLDTISKINAEFGEIRCKNEELQEENGRLVEREQSLVALEGELSAAQETIKLLENEKSDLKLRLEELTSTEANLKEANSHIDNMKHELKLKVSQLTDAMEEMSASLETTQKEKADLHQENSELKRNIEIIYETASSTEVKTENHVVIVDNTIQHKTECILETIKKLNVDKIHKSVVASNLEASREENSQLMDKISKLSVKLQILLEQNTELQDAMNHLQATCDVLRSEKLRLENDNMTTATSIRNLETRQNELLHEHVISQNLLKEQLERCQQQLDDKTRTIVLLEHKLETISPQLEKKDRELASTTEQLEQKLVTECEQNEKLKKDIAIFQAKLYKNRQITDEKEKLWVEERTKLEEKIRTGDERIKDHRLEMEGKLEKMKMKMKSLYNEEVTKIKIKHEREIMDYKSKVEAFIAKNDKYENHVQTLSKQVYNLNETILELQKQNRFMETRLKDYESIPSSSSLRRHSQFAPQMIGSNLRMEDEEGELFNNTYLADLKSGRGSPFGRESVSVSELHYRNSLAAPHLRSTYLAQYPDHHLREEDIKDVPIDLDDSLSSLLHAGQRKKVLGTTSYKKPGPPTPSKNAGRLSFGNTTEPQREILKESNDISFSNVKKMATPSKFSRMFSSYKMKDENSPPKRRLSNIFQRKK